MLKTLRKIGPSDHGKRMSLAKFDHAQVQEGYTYELGRRVIVVSNVPKPRHAAQVDQVREQFSNYKRANPSRIFTLAGGSDCKIMAKGFESERHPDLAVYTTPPPQDEDLWYTWIPALVVEVVSRGSKKRDYSEKQEKYLDFGVREYWIVDFDKRAVTVHRRVGGRWRKKIVKPPEIYRSPLFPGFAFDCKQVFRMAEAVK